MYRYLSLVLIIVGCTMLSASESGALGLAPPTGLAGTEPVPAPGRVQLHSIEEIPNPDVRSVTQDDQGFIWFGGNHPTQGGLIRYDGYETKRYAHDPNDATSLSHSQVYLTYVDNDGELWVGTIRGGLNRYNPISDDFTRYLHDPDDDTSLPSDDIKSMLQTSDGTRWVGTKTGLARIDPTGDTFRSYFHDPDNPNSLPSSAVHAIVENSDTGELWLGTEGGVSVFNPDEETFTNYTNSDDPNSLSENTVASMYQDSEGIIWVGTFHGLNRYNPASDNFTRFMSDPDQPGTLRSDRIMAMLEDSNGRFWVGHDKGLELFDRDAEVAVAFVDEPTRLDILDTGPVQALLEDSSGAIWIGSQTAGAARVSPFAESSEYFRHDPQISSSINSDIVTRVYATDEGIWLLTDVGIEFFDGVQFTDYTSKIGFPAAWPTVHAVLPTDDGALWLGSDAGEITRVDLATGDTESYEVPEPAAKAAVWPVAQADNGDVWYRLPFGDGIGVVRANGDSELLIGDELDDDGPEQVYAYNTSYFFDDEAQVLWVTGLGLARFDLTTSEVSAYWFDPDNPGSVKNQLWSVDQGPDGHLWLASTNGVHEFDPETGTYLKLHRDALPIPGTTDARFGPDGRLWLVSGSNLTGYDTETEDVVVYSAGDESLAENHLDLSSWVVSKLVVGPDDKMYGPTMGRGLVAFSPQELSENTEPPPVVLTGLEVSGRSVGPASDPELVDAPVNRATDFNFGPEQNTFTFTFSALNYEHPERNEYRYRLDGFDDEWHYTTAERRHATYTNVPPGHYTFRVEASNNSAVWSEEGLVVSISVATPWFETIWARTIAILVTLAAAVAIFRWRTRRQRRHNQELEQRLEERARYQEERELLLIAVQQRSDQLNAILSAAPIGVVLLSPDLHVLLENRAATEELQSLSEYTDQGQLDSFGAVPIDSLIGDDRRGSWATTTVGDGATSRVLSITVRPIDQHDDQLGGWVLLWDDVTELQELQRRTERQERLAAVGRFAAGIAHDVNNVLTVIGLNAELINLDGEVSEASRNRLKHINSETARASRFITQILDYSRQSVSVPEVLDICEVINSQALGFSEAVDPRIRVACECDGPGLVRADVTQLEQLVLNLVTNAQHAIGEDGTISIVVDHMTPDPVSHGVEGPSEQGADDEMAPKRWVRLAVIDDGCGIADDVLPMIFEPFVTTKKKGRGTGLGLAQVAGIAAEHGGRVNVETKVGSGTTVSVLLPAIDVNEPVPRAGTPVPAIEPKRRGSGELVLIIDDDASVIAVLEHLLIAHGYRTTTASDRQSAVDALDRWGGEIALILADLIMPELSADELSKALVVRRLDPAVIVMSGVAGFAPSRVDDDLVTAVVRKPIESSSLLKEIAAALSARALI